MRLSIKVILFLLLPVLGFAQIDSSTFQHPPASARPWVFWYWMQGAVSAEGIRADLIAMKGAGIGGAYLMPINGPANPPVYTPVVTQLSPRFWEMVRLAIHVADSLGLEVAMHDCDGFAVAGGPWITPALSMQKVVWTRRVVDGGKTIDVDVQEPSKEVDYYEDIAVLAFRSRAGWYATDTPTVTASKGDAFFLAHPGNKESFKSDDSAWIQYSFARPFTCRSITIHAVNNYQSQRLLVQASDDGRVFRDVMRLIPPRHGWQDGEADVTHAIPATTARYYRFVYDPAGSEPGGEDLDAAKWRPSLKIAGIELSPTPVVNQYEGKSGAVWRVGLPSALPDSLCVDPRSVVDLSAFMDAHGHLRWRAPAGQWTILRVGHTSTGHTNATGGGGKGLECDKFNVEAIKLQFDKWFGEAVRQAGPELAGKVLKIFHVDSWECGSQNWSPVFRDEFRRRRGYDLLMWLPAMCGVPLASADSSERFLHDVRQTIAELLHEQFYGTMADLAHQHGCSFSAESVAPTFTSDGMLHFSQADIPMGEFWLRSPTHDKPNDMLDAISGGHVYGKNVIQAEAFTELRENWDESPGMLKPLQDRNYALGINRMVFHVFTHNPWMDRKPGMTLSGVGTFLQRDQTWWPQARAWIEYTQRCQWLLQQGRPVADIAVFTGEELPRRAVLPERLVDVLPGLVGAKRVAAERLRLENRGTPITKVPNGVLRSLHITDPADWVDPLHGYAFDSFNPDALVRLAVVRDGRVVLPGGASYGLLVIPGATPMNPDAGGMSVEVAGKLLQLVQDGATVLIDPAAAYHSNTLSGRTDAVQAAMRRLLGGDVGKGRVIKGPWRDSTLDRLGISPDVITGWKAIAYTHRQLPDADIYFLSNPSEFPQAGLPFSFRTAGRIPEYWDPLTGRSVEVKSWRANGQYTDVAVYLPPYGSLFIVFRRPTDQRGGFGLMDQRRRTTLDLSHGWTVDFDTAYGGPARPVTFDSLSDWGESADTTIRYYSGTAVYTKNFSWGDDTRDAQLDLGSVGDIATVVLNGIDCGTVWTSNALDISKALHKGNNTLRITVANTWNNRLVGDHRLSEGRRRTWTTAPYNNTIGRLLPGGVMGPVKVVWKP